MGFCLQLGLAFCCFCPGRARRSKVVSPARFVPKSLCGLEGRPHQMASPLPTTGAQGPVLFEDLAVYFSQEECVSLYPAQSSLSRDVAQECLEDVDMAFLEKSSEDEVESAEGTVSAGTPTCKKRLISLLVTIENHTPLVELSQCLGTRALSEILEFPWEEAKNVCKRPECDQNFSDNSCLVLHQKIHLGKKSYECGDCGKIFNHRVNLRTHRRIHTDQKPYTCAKCDTSFFQHSHLSRHMNIHVKEKPYTCGMCRRGFVWLPGLAQHQKTHAAEQAHVYAKCGKYFGQKMNPASQKKTHTLATRSQYTKDEKNLGQTPCLALPKKGPKGEEQFNHCGVNLLSFPTFKPLKMSQV